MSTILSGHLIQKPQINQFSNEAFNRSEHFTKKSQQLKIRAENLREKALKMEQNAQIAKQNAEIAKKIHMIKTKKAHQVVKVALEVAQAEGERLKCHDKLFGLVNEIRKEQYLEAVSAAIAAMNAEQIAQKIESISSNLAVAADIFDEAAEAEKSAEEATENEITILEESKTSLAALEAGIEKASLPLVEQLLFSAAESLHAEQEVVAESKRSSKLASLKLFQAITFAEEIEREAASLTLPVDQKTDLKAFNEEEEKQKVEVIESIKAASLKVINTQVFKS